MWRLRTVVTSLIVIAVLGPLVLLTSAQDRWLQRVGAAAFILVTLTGSGALVRLLTARWRHRLARWRLDDVFVEIEDGWWISSSRRLPIDRVHTMAVNQGPFLRRQSLFEVVLHASGGRATLVLAGVDARAVAEVRRHVGFER